MGDWETFDFSTVTYARLMDLLVDAMVHEAGKKLDSVIEDVRNRRPVEICVALTCMPPGR